LSESLAGVVVANSMRIKGSILLRNFSAEGEVRLYGASVGGNLDCGHGSFKNANGVALTVEGAKIEGAVLLRNGFSAEGEVRLYHASVGGNLDCDHGSFKNANGVALTASLAKIERAVFLNDGFTPVGRVTLDSVTVVGDFDITNAQLAGADMDMQRARVGTLRGEPATWPKPGKLLLDGFLYERLAGAFIGTSHRAKQQRKPALGNLEWLRLQATDDTFSPQPYKHLAKVLREQGQEAAAQDILIGLEDDRQKHGHLNEAQRVWGSVSKWTMKYGYQPLRALWFIGFFVFLGFLVFGWAYQSGELVPSDKEAYASFAQVPTGDLPRATKKVSQLPGSYEGFCALVYSFDTFVPIIDLGQRSRWKPIDRPEDAVTLPKPSNKSVLMRVICDPLALTNWHPLLPPGFVRFYRWLDIITGWFFAGLLAAGVSGLVRRN
jgi:hypothetical protein